MAPLIVNIGYGQHYVPAALTPGNISGTYGMRGWWAPRARLEVFGEEENFMSQSGSENRFVQLVINYSTAILMHKII
jgi:hypothetical protein